MEWFQPHPRPTCGIFNLTRKLFYADDPGLATQAIQCPRIWSKHISKPCYQLSLKSAVASKCWWAHCTNQFPGFQRWLWQICWPNREHSETRQNKLHADLCRKETQRIAESSLFSCASQHKSRSLHTQIHKCSCQVHITRTGSGGLACRIRFVPQPRIQRTSGNATQNAPAESEV